MPASKAGESRTLRTDSPHIAHADESLIQKSTSDLRKYWCAVLGLNQRPLPCQGSALPLS